MPDRPMERIQELVREAERVIVSTNDMVKMFKYVVSEESEKAQNSRDDGIISLMKGDIAERNANLESMQDGLDQLKKLSGKLTQFYYSSKFNEMHKILEDFQDKIHNMEEETKNKKKRNDKEAKDQKNKLKSLRSQLGAMISAYRRACGLLSGLEDIDPLLVKEYLGFKGMDVDELLNDGCSHLFQFRTASKALVEKLEMTFENDGDQSLLEKKKLLSGLIATLEPYRSENMEVLESPIETLYKKLEQEYGLIRDQLSQYELAQNAISTINDASSLSKGADEKYAALGSHPVFDDDGYDSSIYLGYIARRDAVLQQISDLSVDAAQAGVNDGTYSQIYANNREDPLLKNYIGLSLDDLKKSMDDAICEVSETEQRIIDSKARLSELKGDLEECESKEPHPLSGYKVELRRLRQCIDSMNRNFDSKAGMLGELSRGNTVRSGADNDDFLELVWVYLGRRLDTIQHIGRRYTINKIDMNRRVVIAQSGSEIPFKDMGTGESQLAYLSGLLNIDDGRTLIALFDEVDHMDPDIISKIKDRMKTLCDEGKLLIGIMAAPAIGTEVEICE